MRKFMLFLLALSSSLLHFASSFPRISENEYLPLQIEIGNHSTDKGPPPLLLGMKKRTSPASANGLQQGMIDVPLTFEDMHRLSGFPSHKGLQAAIQSMQSHKSARNVYVLILGLANSGQHSFVNNLFGQELLRNDSTEIIEFIANVTLPSIGIRNSQVHMISTPGLTGSYPEDTRILANLVNFLDKHSELSVVYPNLVLVFAPYNNATRDHAAKPFAPHVVKTLQKYDLIRDKFMKENTASNTIFALINEANETSLPNLDEFHTTIRNYTSFGKGAKIMSGVSLDSQDFANQMTSAINQSFDLIGTEMFGTLKVPAKRHSLHFKAQFENATADNSTIEYLEDLFAADELIRGLPPTEVSALLKSAYDTRIDPELRRMHPGSLQFLQRSFHLGNISTPNQIPTTREELVRFLQSSREMNEAMLAILTTAFPVTIPELNPGNLLIGSGYDPITDSQAESPFNFNKKKYCALGRMLPRSVSLKLLDNVEETLLHVFHDYKAYATSRIKDLNLTGVLNVTNYKGETKSGEILLSLLKQGPTNNGAVKFRAIREIRKFALTLDPGHLDFKEEFLNTINYMPGLNFSNKNSVTEWKELLQVYGTHVVSSALGGGYLEATVQVAGAELAIILTGNMTSLTRKFELVLQNPTAPATGQNITAMINLKGGANKFRGMELLRLNTSTQTVSALEEWKRSLLIEPILLPTKFSLVPLSQYVRALNQSESLASDMDKAIKAQLDGKLEFTSPPIAEIKPPPAPINLILSPAVDRKKKNTPVHQPNENVPPAGQPGSKIILASRESYAENNALLDCLQLFIQSLDAQIMLKDGELELIELANDIESLYNKIANSGLASPREKLQIKAACANASRRSPAPIPQLKALVHFEAVDIQDQEHDDTDLVIGSRFPVHAEGSKALNNIKSSEQFRDKIKIIAGSVLNYDLTAQEKQLTDYKFVGNGYDILADSVGPNSPFLLTENSFIKLPLKGFEFPHVSFDYFKSTSDYLKHRFQSLTSDSTLHSILPTNYNKATGSKAGLSIFQPGDHQPLSVLYEFRKFLVKLPQGEQEELHLNEEFKLELGNLPRFNNSDCNSLASWKLFIQRYGSYVVSEAYLGGAIEIKPTSKQFKAQFLKIRDQPQKIKQWLKSGTFQGSGTNFSFIVLGGNSSLFNSSKSFTVAQLNAWIQSIQYNMVMLPVNIKLRSLVQIIQKHSVEENVTLSFLRAVHEHHWKPSSDIVGGEDSVSCTPLQIQNKDENEFTLNCTCTAAEQSCCQKIGENCLTPTTSSNCSSQVSNSADPVQ